jgi:hypothetical protein
VCLCVGGCSACVLELDTTYIIIIIIIIIIIFYLLLFLLFYAEPFLLDVA